MNIGLLSEGPTDVELIPALLKRIASLRTSIHWPLNVRNSLSEVRVRTGGFGQVVKGVRRIIERIHEEPFCEYSFFVVVLDDGAAEARARIRKLIRGNNKFVLGIAVPEIEAWWLADRENTLEWLQLADAQIQELRYGRENYRPERDDNPKRTLDELTFISEAVSGTYSEGNAGLAHEFASAWKDSANLDQIENLCSRGFRPFCQSTTAAMRRAASRKGRRHGRS